MSSPRTATHSAAARGRSTTRPRTPGSSRGTARRNPSRRSSTRRRTAPRRPARGRRPAGVRGIARWWPALLVAAAVFAGVAWGTERTPPVGSCALPASSVTLTTEQMQNAATIAEVARARGLPERAVVIALATAMQESTLRNLDYGDRDSLGLFQQRPSQGWGTPEQVQDPVYAAGKFYDGLVRVPDWETGELTLVADAVQRSAFPRAYAKWATMAEELTTALSPTAGSGSPCG